MGAGSSKSEGSQSTKVFTANTPVCFSSELIDSLQRSPETDTTRANTLELHIQERVHAELERIHQEVSQNLTETYKRISSEPSEPPEPPLEPSIGEKIGERISNAITGEDSEQKRKEASLSRDSVKKEIDELRKKLDARRKLVEADRGVEKAKNDVVACLRMNDRRPLDCWREVAVFKKEVGRLEREFVEKALR